MTRYRKGALVIGAGPAGLACALELGKNQVKTTVIEREAQVGGLCRTVVRNGNYYDIGGHRFFSKNKEVNELWHDVLKDDILYVKRKSRIYYRSKYYHYPLRLLNVVQNLGLCNSLLCVGSYAWSLLKKPGDDKTFEGWVINRFGARLYKIFFKTYTEKVWGIPCKKLSSDWAVQRIQGMSMKRAILDAVFKNQSRKTKSFIKNFLYPMYGPGQFCQKLQKFTEQFGVDYRCETDVISIHHNHNRVTHVYARQKDSRMSEYHADIFFSSIPISVLLERFDPKPPKEVMDSVSQLNFRSFLVVNLVLNKENIFDDNWIYIHEPKVRVARIQNYKNWSHYMVKDLTKTTLGMEYFVNENDDVWSMTDADLINQALGELQGLNLCPRDKYLEGFVIRVPKVYPIYDEFYQEHLNKIKEYLSRFKNLQVMGRCGMFRYDNSDHAILTGLFAARNFFESHYDLWAVNTEKEYHEELGPYNKDVNGDR
ncbi:NAD(P)/FAD-dependent oxidoreductase [PVC group bacterium]|nr:NAD(P)/FAD-dependent oxidoreductase [PVC group bacterium]